MLIREKTNAESYGSYPQNKSFGRGGVGWNLCLNIYVHMAIHFQYLRISIESIFVLTFFKKKSQLYCHISLLLLSNFYNFTFSRGDHTIDSKQPPKGSSKGTSYKL